MTIRELANRTVLVPPEGGKASWLLGHLFEIRATKEHTRGTYSLTEMTVAPAPLLGAPPHIHKAADEAFYILEGAINVQVGDETVLAEPGAFIFITRGTVHAFSNPGSTPARFLFILSPPGFEGFFEEAGEPASERVLPEPPEGPPDIERIAAIGEKYNMETLRPETQ